MEATHFGMSRAIGHTFEGLGIRGVQTFVAGCSKWVSGFVGVESVGLWRGLGLCRFLRKWFRCFQDLCLIGVHTWGGLPWLHTGPQFGFWFLHRPNIGPILTPNSLCLTFTRIALSSWRNSFRVASTKDPNSFGNPPIFLRRLRSTKWAKCDLWCLQSR